MILLIVWLVCIIPGFIIAGSIFWNDFRNDEPGAGLIGGVVVGLIGAAIGPFSVVCYVVWRGTKTIQRRNNENAYRSLGDRVFRVKNEERIEEDRVRAHALDEG